RRLGRAVLRGVVHAIAIGSRATHTSGRERKRCFMGDDNGLEVLAARLRQGDPAAAAEFKGFLEPQMIHIVRRALQGGTANSAIDQWILATVRRMVSTPGTPSERFASQVARVLCQAIIDRLSPQTDGGPRASDTVCGL